MGAALGAPMGAPLGAPPATYIGPPGLEYLAMVDQLLIKQKVEILEAFTGFESANKYKVLNSLGQDVFSAKEDTDCCTRQCCGPSRPFEMNILDNQQQEVLHLVRSLRCQSCCFPCCLQELEVPTSCFLLGSPNFLISGSLTPRNYHWHCWAGVVNLLSKILDKRWKWRTHPENWGTFLWVWVLLWCGLCPLISSKWRRGTWAKYSELFKLCFPQLGKISKQWSGLGKEVFTDADNFGISFPLDLDVKVNKVLLKGLTVFCW